MVFSVPPKVFQAWIAISDPQHPSHTRGWGIPVACIVLYALALAVITARIWARVRIQKNTGIDDVLILIAIIPLTGLLVATVLAFRRYGFDRHTWDITSQMAVNSRKIALAIEYNYCAVALLVKISILLFYRRMSNGPMSKTFRYFVRGCIAFVVLWYIAFLIPGFFICRPYNSYWNSANIGWDQTHKQGVDWSCFDEGSLNMACAIISVIQDCLVFGIPMVVFWKVRLPPKQKIALMLVFGVGFFICLTGILRVYYTYVCNHESGLYDVMWDGGDAWLWTAVEAFLGIICASAPALKVYLERYLTSSSPESALRFPLGRKSYGVDPEKGRVDVPGVLPSSDSGSGSANQISSVDHEGIKADNKGLAHIHSEEKSQ